MFVTVHNYKIGEGTQLDVARTAQARCDRLAAEFVAERLGGFHLSDVKTTEGKVLASLLSR